MQMNRFPRRRRAVIAAAAAVFASVSSFSFGQTSGSWVVDANASWSVAGNWSPDIPDGGGVASFYMLPSFSAAPRTVSQDLPTVTLDRIEWNTLFTFSITRPAATTNTITLTGAAELRHNVPSAVGYGTTTANGQLISVPFAGSDGLHKTGPGVVTISSTASTFTGGVFVEGGTLRLAGGDTVLGNAANSITLDGGTLRHGATFTSSRVFNLIGTGTIETNSNATYNGIFTGNGSLVKSASQTGTFTANNDFTGSFFIGSGSIIVNGNGAFSATSSILANGTITLDNVATNNTDRLNDAAPVTFNGSGLVLNGNTAGTTERIGATTIDRALTGITINPAAGASAALTSPSIARVNGGAVFYRGTSLGSTPGANVANITYDAAPALSGAGGADGSTSISILPYAYGATSVTANNNDAGNSLVTYGANGIRPLNAATEYVSSIAGATSADNVRITSAQSVDADTSINALVISTGGSVGGSSQLTINSGVVLAAAVTNISVPLNFGAAEAILHAPNYLTLSGPISGSGGLSKTGLGSATFTSAASTYTGTTTIGGGSNFFTASVGSGVPSPFGSSTTAIVLAGGDFNFAELYYSGAGPATFDRPLRVDSLNALLNTALLPEFGPSVAQTLTMNGAIQLDSPLTMAGVPGSNLILNGKISGPGIVVGSQNGTVTIANADNDYTGGTEMGLETWQIAADHPFGSGVIRLTPPALSPGGPTILAIGGPRVIPNDVFSLSSGNASSTFWTIGGSEDIEFSGTITLSNFGSANGQVTHHINNTGLTTYSGRLTLGGLTKAGAGTLVLSGDNDYNSPTTVNAGVLRVTSSTGLGFAIQGTTVASGAALEMANNALSTEPVTISGSGIAGDAGTIRSTSGDNTLGHVTLASASSVGVDAGTLGVGNVAGAFALTKVGAGQLNAERYRVGNLNVNAGTAAVTLGGAANDKVSTITTLVIPGGATPTATLDLGDNDLIATATPQATMEALVKHGRNGGAWNGTGVTTSAARGEAPQIHGLGVLSGAEFLGIGNTAFDGITVNAADTLVKYTYYGDTDFNGVVNFDDYARVDSGFLNNRTGWLNGDFDYSGVINFDDYALMDVAFLSQSGPLRPAIDYLLGNGNPEEMNTPALMKVVEHFDQFGQPYANSFLSAVPEPGAVSCVAALALCGMTRRQRRRLAR